MLAFRRGDQTELDLDVMQSHLEVENIGILISCFDFLIWHGDERTGEQNRDDGDI
jgi:hypothetical protein